MLDPYQVAEARAWGADCILIIMAAVDDALRRRLLMRLAELGAWTCWSRCTTQRELDRALTLDCRADRHQQPQSQDLRDRRLRPPETLAPAVPEGRILVGESGIFTHADLHRLAKVGVRTPSWSAKA